MDEYSKYKTKKTIAFLIIDFMMMVFYAWIWLSFIHETPSSKPATESVKYVMGMTLFFGTYYFLFERIGWDFIKKTFGIYMPKIREPTVI